MRAPRSTPRATPAASTSTTSTAPSACRGEAPFGGIAVAAAAREPPPALLEQLEPRGRLVIPIGPPPPAISQGLRADPRGPRRIRRRPVPVRAARPRRLTFAQRPLRLDSMAAWGPSLLRRSLHLPVRLHGIQLGRPTDLLLDVESWHVLGFVVRCGDEAVRFLPWAASQPVTGGDRGGVGADAARRRRVLREARRFVPLAARR